MKRHHIVTLVILSLLAPAMAAALPRPDSTQTAQPQLLATIQVNANDSIGMPTPELKSGWEYTIKVNGTWKPSTALSHFADAAFETTNNSTWSRTGKGLVIGLKNLGSDTTIQYDSNHQYSVPYIGRGVPETLRINDPDGTSDNTGSLSVSIYGFNEVNYVVKYAFTVDAQTPAIPYIQLDLTGASRTVTVNETTQTVGPVETPGSDDLPANIPALGEIRLKFNECESGGYQAAIGITVLGTQLSDISPANCLPDHATLRQHYKDQTFALGGTFERKEVLPTTTVLNPIAGTSSCLAVQFIGIPFFFINGQLGLVLGPGQGDPGSTNCRLTIAQARQPQPLPVIPPGSKVEATFTWNADRSRLWKTILNSGDGTFEAYSPINPLSVNDSTWFQSKLVEGTVSSANSLSPINPSNTSCPLCASIQIIVRGPDGGFITGTGIYPWKIAGLGQFIEALFTSKVNGQ